MFTNVLCTNDAYFHVLIDDIGEGGTGTLKPLGRDLLWMDWIFLPRCCVGW